MTSAGNPIEMDLKTMYKLKGLGKEQTIASKIIIKYDEQSGKILKVEDKWDGQLPNSGFKDVSSLFELLSPWWWLHYYEGWLYWGWSRFVKGTSLWQVGASVKDAHLPAALQRQAFEFHWSAAANSLFYRLFAT